MATGTLPANEVATLATKKKINIQLVWHLAVGSSPPEAVVCSKGWAVRPLKRYVSWIQNGLIISTEDKQIVSSERKVPEMQCNDMATTIDAATKIVVCLEDKHSTVPVEAVDTLSNEEFRLTIETFIKKNQIFFEKQRLAETEPEKYERIVEGQIVVKRNGREDVLVIWVKGEAR
ncbi:hypothetical protein HAX54_035396, partial [Datura stramonium]|nr:hypothetical protein [Datura stramonium]